MVCVKLNEGIPSLIQTLNGVPQGCVLSSTLFNIFMSDLPNKLCREIYVQLDENPTINCLLWADDIVLLSESEGGLNTLLQDLQEYSETNDSEVDIKKISMHDL